MDEFIPFPVQVIFPPAPTPVLDDEMDEGNGPEPTTVAFTDYPIPPFAPSHLSSASPPSQKIAQMSCGPHYNLAVTESGHLYTWGLGLNGELGRGRLLEESAVPGRVKFEVASNTGELGVDGEGGQKRWRVESAHGGGQHVVVVARLVGVNDT